MTQVPLPAGIEIILLDIEGTTTPIAFVHDVLFSYARRTLHEFLIKTWASTAVQSAVTMLAAELARDVAGDVSVSASVGAWPTPPSPKAVEAYALWLMDRDRKSPGLKALQGLIWERGYREGALSGELFADVAPAFAAWRSRGIRIAIYSSGSVLAQKLLFSTTAAGDLTPSIDAFFDTAVGAKGEAASYARIASAMHVEPSRILFVSDVVAELNAAAAVGCRTALSVRPGNAPATPAADIVVIHSLLELTS